MRPKNLKPPPFHPFFSPEFFFFSKAFFFHLRKTPTRPTWCNQPTNRGLQSGTHCAQPCGFSGRGSQASGGGEIRSGADDSRGREDGASTQGLGCVELMVVVGLE